MHGLRAPKKTQTLEVRLSEEAKAALMAHCRSQGRTASETVRELIDALPHSPPRTAPWRAMLTGLACIGLGAGLAAPSFAQTEPVDRGSFDRLDRDHDGRLSYAEFAAR